jgi:hypothetical protein
MLKIDGNDLIRDLDLKPGPVVGKLLHILLDICLENPVLNTKTALLDKAKDLLKLSENDLETLYMEALHTKQEENQKKIDQIKKTYKVS